MYLKFDRRFHVKLRHLLDEVGILEDRGSVDMLPTYEEVLELLFRLAVPLRVLAERLRRDL